MITFAEAKMNEIPISHLEGLFDNPMYKTYDNTEEAEDSFLLWAVKEGCAVNDIVGIAFAKGMSGTEMIYSMFLTARGMRESQSTTFSREYDTLDKIIHPHTSGDQKRKDFRPLRTALSDGTIQRAFEAYGQHAKYIDLKGRDCLHRMLIVYSHNNEK